MWLYKKNTKKALGDRLALDESSRLMWASSVRHIYSRPNKILILNTIILKEKKQFKYTGGSLPILRYMIRVFVLFCS